MFVLATADISVSFRLLLRDLPAAKKHEIDPSTAHSRSLAKTPLFITNNFIADILLVYRCYMVWGQRTYILIGSMALLAADTILGYVNADGSIFFYHKVMPPLFISTTLAINVIMTIATAGRIWWTIYTMRLLLPEQTVRRCAVALAVIIESGAIYSASLVLFLFTPLFLLCLPIRLVGIMPTLMIVQVEFGRNFYLEVETPPPRTPPFLNPPDFDSPVKNWETLEPATGTPVSPPAGIPLTFVTGRFRDPSESPSSSGVSLKRPLHVQPNSKETLGR
ncbi:hypothetical protein BDZ94DRAFT_1308464 [Collybia nuda]|uniref:Uncharacterized protein n=1 Tax=Collybia nuda TaxID=64659 RepID=A0A9P5Y9S8_9AGAR|nr:hypothetical protein BDZ94DRAFT_1308464 [Collybia nuda]